MTIHRRRMSAYMTQNIHLCHKEFFPSRSEKVRSYVGTIRRPTIEQDDCVKLEDKFYSIEEDVLL